MQRIAFGVVLGAMLAASSTVLAQAPSWTPPPENQRCPSKWGAGDERGSGNHMKPQTVLNAVKLIKTGEVMSSDTCSMRICRSSARDASTCTSNAHS